MKADDILEILAGGNKRKIKIFEDKISKDNVQMKAFWLTDFINNDGELDEQIIMDFDKDTEMFTSRANPEVKFSLLHVLSDDNFLIALVNE